MGLPFLCTLPGLISLSSLSAAAPPVGSGGHSSLSAEYSGDPFLLSCARGGSLSLLCTTDPFPPCRAQCPPVGQTGAPLPCRVRRAHTPCRAQPMPLPLPARQTDTFPPTVHNAPLPLVGQTSAPLPSRVRWAPSLPNAADAFPPSYAAGGYLFSLSYTAAPLPLVGQTDTSLLCRVRQPPPAGHNRYPLPARQASPPHAERRWFPLPPLKRAHATHLPAREQTAFLHSPIL